VRMKLRAANTAQALIPSILFICTLMNPPVGSKGARSHHGRHSM
jgi:hypothetical protein